MSRSQRDLKAMRQAQREEAAARQRARDRRNLFIVAGGLAVVAIAIVLVAAILNNQARVAQANRIKFQQVTTAVGQAIPDEGTATHIDPSTTATYEFYPPPSGPHDNVAGFAPVDWQTIATLQDGQFVNVIHRDEGATSHAVPDHVKRLVSHQHRPQQGAGTGVQFRYHVGRKTSDEHEPAALVRGAETQDHPRSGSRSALDAWGRAGCSDRRSTP